MYNLNSLEHLNIPAKLKCILIDHANHSLAVRTWNTYKSSLKMLSKCSDELMFSYDFPLKEETILTFIAWCLEKRNTASTIKSYLSGLRQAHIALGLKGLNLNTDLVHQVLTGSANIALSSKSNKKRVPCTLNILKLLKAEIKASSLSNSMQILVWSVCCIAFFGAFRMAELLSKRTSCYNPDFTLLKKDVKLLDTIGSDRKCLQFKIKNSKTNKTGKPEIVDVYATNTSVCPIKAYIKLQVITKNSPPDAPMFCGKDGKPLVLSQLNKLLNKLVGKQIQGGKLTGHSFRAGLISMFAKLGHNSQELKQIGRWSSRAYESYIKLGRTNRQQIAVACSKIDAKL